MAKIHLHSPNGKTLAVEEGVTFEEVIKEEFSHIDIPITLGRLDKHYYELRDKIPHEGQFYPVTIEDTLGLKTYARTLHFILIKAVYDLFQGSKITIEHSISKGIYGEIHKENSLDEKDIEDIKNRMKEIIREDQRINKISVTREEAINIFKEYGFEDKIRLLKHIKNNNLKLYELQGRYDYFYGPLAPNTGVIKTFDLVFHDPGFILRYPEEKNPKILPKFVNYEKLDNIFKETEEWLNILEVADVGAINNKIENNEIQELIMVAEALHEKKIAYIADTISEKKDVKVILISGPSSSGKTTFARRLGIQLRANGIIPTPISLDDYFVNRDDTPLDENGEYDFESIDALDLSLFNEDLNRILRGEEVEIPSYNFKLGVREWNGHKIKLPDNGVLIIEGIHGLNDRLTNSIENKNKFKIYISALTQLNIDNHNRISTTDVRKVRRIVRDFLSRGYMGEATLKMWPSIKRGEEKNIFVFQEEADVMFNSTLVYELCVLKKYALEELEKVDENSEAYYEALRLKNFLRLFKDVDIDIIPTNSILREFIGGSVFYKY
ncbi:nucleoside kinase [Clostridium sp.]|uniref:nucleoside kinase n=1 Tax=Clostridium sp. TaxID=1506 RepID=UPI003463AE65